MTVTDVLLFSIDLEKKASVPRECSSSSYFQLRDVDAGDGCSDCEMLQANRVWWSLPPVHMLATSFDKDDVMQCNALLLSQFYG